MVTHTTSAPLPPIGKEMYGPAASKSFTTVTSAFRDTPVANAKLTGWWKLDGNLLDSSGNNNHGEAKFTFKPSDLSDLELWLDAKDESSVAHSSNAVSQWSDKSGNNKHVTQGTAASKPTFSTNGLNSMPTLSFDGTNDFLNRNDANPTLGSTDLDSRTGGDTWSVFVVGQGGANTVHQGGGGRSSTFIGKGGGIGSGGTFALGLLTHNGANSALSTPRWFVQQNGFSGSGAEANNNWTPGAINSPVVIGAIWDGSVTTGTLNGSAFLNSGPIGTASNQNSELRIGAISSTYGNCKISEVLIFDTALSTADREKIEGYLAHRWSLTSSLPVSHPFKEVIPVTGNSPFTTDTFSNSGRAFDLTNGAFATVSTGGTEDTFDGDSNFSVSMWVKGWPSDPGQSLIAKDDYSPANYGKLMTWLDATYPQHLSTNEGISPPGDGQAVMLWYDRSGNGHHARKIVGKGPYWKSSDLNSKPTMQFDYSTMLLDDSNESFDAWSEMEVFAVMDELAANTWRIWFGKTNATNNGTSSNTSWHFLARRPDQNPAAYRFRVNGTSGGDAPEISTSHSNKVHDPMIINLRFGGGTRKLYLNGTEVISQNDTGNIGSSSHPVSIGGSQSGGGSAKFNLSEFIIFNDVMTDAERILIEGNLAHKWSLTSVLPSGHAHKSTAPTVGGWAVERGPSGQNDITLDLTGAGGEFTQPTTIDDGDWHQLTVTFGSGNKKVYIDGLQIGTASQSGSVTDSALKLVLGDPDPFGSVATRAKIDDVRFYRGVLSANEIAAIHNGRAGDIGVPKFALDSPSTLAGSNGRSVSYQISANPAYGLTGYNSSISYSLLNAPSWLSVGSTSGLVTGTPPSSGIYDFQVRAVNSLGSNVQDVSLSVADFGNWDYSLSFTTDFNGSTPIEEWNMVVRLSDDNSTGPGAKGFRYSQCSSNGGDLRFIDKDGQELSFEIANWNTAGESQVWVRTPTLKSDANITMFWGNPSAGLPSYANNGSAWNDYFGVYHLEQATGPASDSSPSGNHLSAINAPVLNSSGLAGTAYSTTASAENGFLANALNGSIKAKEGTYTIWAKTPSNPTDEKDWFGVQYNNDPNYVLRVESSSSSPPTPLVNSSFDLSNISGLKLWLDASNLSSAGSTWSDLSGNNNHASKTGSPTLRTNAYNGKAVMDYNGSNSEYHSFSRISDIRTVFWMLAKDTTANDRFLLGDTSTYHFHGNGNNFFHTTHAHTNVKNGLIKVNGSSVNGTSTGMPGSLSVISLRTIGNVQANSFTKDRNDR